MIRDFDNIEEVAKLLIVNEIDATLLCDFIQEAIESQEIFHSLTERVLLEGMRTNFTKEFLENLKRFCMLLGQVKTQYVDLLHNEYYHSETEKRAAMIKTVDKFLLLLNR